MVNTEYKKSHVHEVQILAQYQVFFVTYSHIHFGLEELIPDSYDKCGPGFTCLLLS